MVDANYLHDFCNTSYLGGQAQQLFQRDAQTITPEALENVKAAIASSEIEHKAENKKKAVPRKAAGQTWEDPTLADWPESEIHLSRHCFCKFVIRASKCYFSFNTFGLNANACSKDIISLVVNNAFGEFFYFCYPSFFDQGLGLDNYIWHVQTTSSIWKYYDYIYQCHFGLLVHFLEVTCSMS